MNPVTPALFHHDAIQRHTRTESLRLIDYSPFPRVDVDQGPRMGLSLNESDSGLCVAVDNSVKVGSLLRILIRGVDGRPARDVVTRVVWCKTDKDGRMRAGLAFLREGRASMLKVRRNEHRTQAVINA
jgi:hypothetical protein